MTDNGITTLYYAVSNGIHFQMQEYNKAHSSKMELFISACEGSGKTAMLMVQLHPPVLICYHDEAIYENIFSPLYSNSSKLQQRY